MSESLLSEFAERLSDVTRQGQSRLAELRAAAEGSIELQQQLLLQVEQVTAADPWDADRAEGSEGAGAETESQVAELRSEMEWLQSELLDARDMLAKRQSDADESALLSELEQARRDLKSLQEDLEESQEQARAAQARASEQEERPSYLVQSDDDGDMEQLRLAEEELEKRDQQIAELQSQLEAAASQPSVEPESAAADPFADEPDIVAEREKLRKLQEEWQEKLRTAELEISIERARMARERNEMEERVSMMESELQVLQGTDPKETARGKWFARLGLKDD